ncbi:hypothetical protein [Salmonella sp. s51944]|uniref:hypothetical protein n=1 Tax=unclassified Salmonella TaxID=2614656 RepID=UPI00398178CA
MLVTLVVLVKPVLLVIMDTLDSREGVVLKVLKAILVTVVLKVQMEMMVKLALKVLMV